MSVAGVIGLAGMGSCLIFGAQPGLSHEKPGDRSASGYKNALLKAPFPELHPNDGHIRVAQAQEGEFAVFDVAGEPSQPIPLRIDLPDGAIGDYGFFRIEGLPEGFRLSSGFPIKEAWLVATRSIGDLQIIPAERFVGDLTLQILLFKEKNAAPEAYTVAVRIRPQEVAIKSSSQVPTNESVFALTNPPADTRESGPSIIPERQLSKIQEDSGMDRANTILKNADIAAARLIYESLAVKGSGRAAFAMGQTFDPQFLDNYVIKGLKPDLDEAMKWYKLAVELGNSQAQVRLYALIRD